MILDASGSMSAIRDATIDGFNMFLDEQRGEPGAATVSMYEFADTVDQVYHARPLDSAPALTTETYTPGGSTALHDAIVTGFTDTAHHVVTAGAGDDSDSVIIVILTDGKENASDTSQAQVRDQVETYQATGWEFLFIGANQDAALTAEKMSIDADHSLDIAYNETGATKGFQSTSRQVTQARRHGTTDGFDEADRDEQEAVEDS
jgi:uncharacterized protein YegL